MITRTKQSVVVAMFAATLMPIADAEAQNQGKGQLVEEWRDGDYMVRRYLITDVPTQNSNYEIHFEINSAAITSGYEDNNTMLDALDKFFTETQSMPTRHIKAIAVTGYASPDGTTASNSRLAQQRAEQLATFLIDHYGLSKSNIVLTSHVEPWSATADAIEHSELSNRHELATMVEQQAPPMTIDHNLKSDKGAWAYIAKDILPHLRRTTIVISYTEDKYDTVREYSPLPRENSEVIIIEEVVAEKPQHHHHKAHHNHHNIVLVDSWEGIIIDAGASKEQ